MSINSVTTLGFSISGGLTVAVGDTVTQGFSIASSSTLTAADVWNYKLEGNYTAKQLMRIMMAAVAGVATGLEPQKGSPTYKSINGNIDRIKALTDRFGNRSSIELDGS